MDAVRTLEGEVRELIRRSGLDPVRDEPAVRRLVRDAVSDYDSRSMHGGMALLPDLDEASKSLWDSIVGYGPLQQYFDDPTNQGRIWLRAFAAARRVRGTRKSSSVQGRERGARGECRGRGWG